MESAEQGRSKAAWVQAKQEGGGSPTQPKHRCCKGPEVNEPGESVGRTEDDKVDSEVPSWFLNPALVGDRHHGGQEDWDGGAPHRDVQLCRPETGGAHVHPRPKQDGVAGGRRQGANVLNVFGLPRFQPLPLD